MIRQQLTQEQKETITMEKTKLRVTEILKRGLTPKTIRYWEAGLPNDGLVKLAVAEANEPPLCLEEQAYAESMINILIGESERTV
jgi:hypothetical protein